MRCPRNVVWIVPLLALAAVGVATAGDWPAWRGPDRTGVSSETGLLKEWPKEGPPLVWKATGLGSGFSTPSVAAGRIYLLGGRGGNECVVALDADGGKTLWESKVGPLWEDQRRHPGTRSTPTVDGELVYAIGSDGDLVCLETAGGKERWRKHMRKDFGGSHGTWAYAESPLIDGDVLVCSPGGRSATMVALDKKTGEVIWKAALDASGSAGGYSSAIVAEVGGVRQYVQFVSGGVVGVSAKDGKSLWRYTKTAARQANIPTVIFHDGHVFTANGYGVGAGLVKLTPGGGDVSAEEVYFSRDLVNHHGGVVRVGDYLYGTNNSSLLCLKFKDGAKPVWSDRAVGKGSVTAADGHLYVRGERGPVALVEATPDGYKEKGRFDQPDRSRLSAWPHPVIANGRLYLRDQDVLLCYDVKQK